VSSRLILRNPPVFKTLRREVDQDIGREKDITRARIQGIPYLHNVLKESE
jgi:Cytochrome P450